MSLAEFSCSVLASILAAVAYSAFFARRESKIRNFLSKTRSGWRRRRYVRIFIDAVRGEAKATDTRTLANLTLIFPVAFLFLSFAMQFIAYDQIATVEVAIRQQQVEKTREPKPLPTTQNTETDLRRIKSRAQHLLLLPQGLAAACAAWYLWIMFVRIP